MTDPSSTVGPSKALVIGLWIAQVVIAVIFCMAGFIKLTTPIATLSQQMPWAGQAPVALVRFTALADLAGGLGILLPALTRIQPQLTVWAALGSSVLLVLAGAFHASRGEYPMVPVCAVLLALAVFVWWGRSRKAPIAAR